MHPSMRYFCLFELRYHRKFSFVIKNDLNVFILLLNWLYTKYILCNSDGIGFYLKKLHIID